MQTRTKAKWRFTHVYHMIRGIALVPQSTYSKRDCNCINRTLSPTTWVFHLVLGLLSIYASNKKGQWATFREWKVYPEEFNKKRDLDGLQTFSTSETFSEW